MLFSITTGSSNPYTPPLYSACMAFQDNLLTWFGIIFGGGGKIGGVKLGRKFEYYVGVKYA